MKCRTVSGLLRAIQQGKEATLSVFSYNERGTWGEAEGVITLNRGEGRYCMISTECFKKIQNNLMIIKC